MGEVARGGEAAEFRSDVTVELVRSSARRQRRAVRGAGVDQGRADPRGRRRPTPSARRGLINYLMRSTGTDRPFEHNSMTFYVQAPIFVFRELMRHRIASYNEESGRYRELRPVFYVPGPDRKLVQEGKPGALRVRRRDRQSSTSWWRRRPAQVCTEAYAAYQRMLDAGIAREVARIVLPLTIYSSAYVTVNARSLMNFLSLRTRRDDSAFPSFPQREIEMVAEKMEAAWAKLMPISHAAFERNHRVAP